MRVIVLRDRAEGNESIGEMWTEARVFDASTTLAEVVEWANTYKLDPERGRQLRNVRLQLDDGEVS